MAQIFLSYDRRDAAHAELIVDALERAGNEVWWDRHIEGGRRFGSEIEQALEAAEAVVVLWSANAVQSDWVKDEAAVGRDTGRLIPTTLDGTRPPLGFRQYQTLDLAKLRPFEMASRLDGAVRALADTERTERRSAVSSSSKSRRNMLVAGAAGLGLAAAGGGALHWLRTPKKPPAEVESLLAQAWQAWTQGTGEGNGQAIGLYRRAIEINPDFADSWGLLSCAYGDRGHGMGAGERTAVWQRALEAGRRAMSLDPKNAYGRMGVAYARPLRGNWALMEREFRQADKDQPGKFLVNYSLALLLGDVGRFAEASRLFGSLEGTAPTAMQYFFHAQALWASGQPGEADRLVDDATEIFASHRAIWQQRFDMALHSGRAISAIAQAEDSQTRPNTIGTAYFEAVIPAARASLTRDPAELRAATDRLKHYARENVQAAHLSIELASLLRQLDAAFEFAEALFFSRGFAVPDRSYGADEVAEVTLDDRRTRVLFLPSTAAMRADSRFDRLVGDLKLAAYWSATRSRPDYRRA